MSRPSIKRAEIMAAMEDATRTISAQNLVISQAIAEHLAINSSDLECLNLARGATAGGVTAGELAGATGLTSGAITGVIDRLERAGLVVRGRDASDRRKVIVRPTACVEKTVPQLFEPLHRSMTAMWASYSDNQLELILDFLLKCRDLMHAEGVALRRGEPKIARKPAHTPTLPRKRGREASSVPLRASGGSIRAATKSPPTRNAARNAGSISTLPLKGEGDWFDARRRSPQK